MDISLCHIKSINIFGVIYVIPTDNAIMQCGCAFK